MDIYLLVQEFYALEAVSAMLSMRQNNRFEAMRHSHSRWHRDFSDFRDLYIQKLASAIFDYTVMVVAAELRHCRGSASQYLYEYYDYRLARDAVYRGCTIYSAASILAAGIRMFDSSRVSWKRAYGGEKWMQIAKAGLMKGNISDCAFIDHCVDLSHNNSVYFDKCANIFHLGSTRPYQEFLDTKRSCEPQLLLRTRQGDQFHRLLLRANNLNIIAAQPTEVYDLYCRNKTENLLFNYSPLVWGSWHLNCSESHIGYYWDGCEGEKCAA